MADDETSCSHCGQAMRSAAVFCGACGAPRVDPCALEGALVRAPLEHLEVGARGLFRVRLNNRGARADSVTLALAIDGRPLEESPLGPLDPGAEAIAVAWHVPETSGFHELAGLVRVTSASGTTTLHIAPVHLRVGGDKAPVSITIDQSHARVVDNSRSMFGAGPSGGLVGEAQWQPLTLVAQATTATASIVPARVAARPVEFAVTTARATYDLRETIGDGDIATVFGGHRRGPDAAPIALKLVNDRADNDLIQHEVEVLTTLRASARSPEGLPGRRPEGLPTAASPGDNEPPTRHLPIVIDQMKTADGRLGTVFERVDGLDLNELRRRLPGGVPARHLVWMMRRALAILAWSHSRGILHGNIEPAHILVRPRDHMLWLVDWSWAVVNPARTGQGFKALNATYSPPEVHARKAPLPASDLYALGKCMIFASGGDPTDKRLPDMDARLARFLRFLTVESTLGRPQDALEMYSHVDRVREQIWGPHSFVELDVPGMSQEEEK